MQRRQLLGSINGEIKIVCNLGCWTLWVKKENYGYEHIKEDLKYKNCEDLFEKIPFFFITSASIYFKNTNIFK